MKKVYPVILSPDDFGYLVTIPDIDRNTQGRNLPEAIDMARDAIGIWAICEQDAGRIVPEPSSTEPPHAYNELVSWVDIDFDEYRRSVDMATVRTNVSLPRYLKQRADAAGLSCSQELQTRLREVLQIA